MMQISKILIFTGIILIILGLLLKFFGSIKFIGRLPGDIYIRRENFTLYIPLATSVLLSIVISLVLWLWGRK